MTENSFICNIIHENKENWKGYFETIYPSIIIKGCDENPNYFIFNYGYNSDFHDKVVQEARGIIIDVDREEVVCWPFRKFGKYTESYADTIDWSTAVVQEKLDGSIIKLWYDRYASKWVFSTNSVIYAKNATLPNGMTYDDLIKQAKSYSILKQQMDDDTLNKELTYIFELVSPLNTVVVQYNVTELFHTGTRNNRTGEEYENVSIGIATPFRYNIHSLDKCIEYAESYMNTSEDGRIHFCWNEGFVVVDHNWNRIKVKSPVYMVLHNISSGTKTSKMRLLDMLYNDLISIDDINKDFPDMAHWINYYSFKLHELKYTLKSFINITRELYMRSGNDRKRIADIIKTHPYKSIGFKALDNELTVDELLIQIGNGNIIKALDKFIPDYEPMNQSYLFKDFYSKEK